jgi:hypothetical protein
MKWKYIPVEGIMWPLWPYPSDTKPLKSRCVYLSDNGTLYAFFPHEGSHEGYWYKKELGRCWEPEGLGARVEVRR